MSEKSEVTEQQEAVVAKPNRIFVGNLSFDTTDESIKESFNKFGKIENVTLITRGKRSLGYGFIEFSNEEEANKAVEGLNGKEINGREIKVEIAAPKAPAKKRERRRRKKKTNNTEDGENKQEGGENKTAGGRKRTRRPRKPREDRPPKDTTPSTNTLFVANIPFGWKDEDLSKVFGELTIVDAHVVTRFNGSSKGYGFVEFPNEDEQKKGLSQDKKEFDSREIIVKVANKGSENEVRKARLAAEAEAKAQESDNTSSSSAAAADSGNKTEEASA